MVYSLVYDELIPSNTVIVPWKYLFETFLPTVGWTCTALGENDEQGASLSTNMDQYFFLKKTMEFIDGTTEEISFCIELEPAARDLQYWGWDGVKATNDDSDPDYGRGNIVLYSDTSFNGLFGGRFRIWNDETDAWFITLNSTIKGWWFKNGGWIRNEYVHDENVGLNKISNHIITAPCFEDTPAIFYGNSRYTAGNNLPLIESEKNMLTDYVMITARSNSSTWAVWRDVANEMLMRAGPVSLNFDTGTRTVRIDSEAGSTYYWGPSDVSDTYGIYFNVGNTDPGY